MAKYQNSTNFINLVKDCGYDINKIYEQMKLTHKDARKKRIKKRIDRLRQKGLLPLESGNKIQDGQQLKSTSTLYDKDGNLVLQWVKSEKSKEDFLKAYQEAIEEIAKTVPPVKSINSPKITDLDLLTLYITNDLHLGMLSWAPETNNDWNLDKAIKTTKTAIDYLVASAPSSNTAIIADLGDMIEADNSLNQTPKSGNPLDTDSRYPKVLRAAYEILIYAIQKALTKHKQVVFINVGGNHDVVTHHAVREVIKYAFKDIKYVTVDNSPSLIKYYQFQQVLLQFTHGDTIKLKDTGEIMAYDCADIFSQTKYRFAHLGHTHVDKVVDTRLCRAESHRNLPPNNHWAFSMGYRRPLGTMKAITYHKNLGEISRNTFNVTNLN